MTTVPNGTKVVELINTSTKWQEKVDAMESITRYVTGHGSSISANSEAFVVFALHMTNQMKASNINILKCGMENLLAIAKNCPMGKRMCLLIVPCILSKVWFLYSSHLDPRQEAGSFRERPPLHNV